MQVLKAASWIIGEYSEVISYIVNDEKLESEEQDEEDDDDDDGYWIEGPNGDEIMSTYRGHSFEPFVYIYINTFIVFFR